MGRKYKSIVETIGNTPVVRINRLAPQGVNVFVKIEAFNPLGSVKDRLALGVIEAAERSGELKPGQTVIEATSGNTGIGLAMVTKAVELANKHGWFLTRQFENEANPDYHSRTTAREIVEDFKGEKLDYWVTGYGTGGTLKGVSRVLAKEMPNTKIIVCEPEEAQLLGSGIEQVRNPDGSAAAPHPAFKPHPMQGWTPDFIPKLTADAVAMKVIDRIITVPGSEAIHYAGELARKEGIFVGITGGATFAGALRVCAEAPTGANILAMLPDTGERYLSTPLFANVPADMTPEELDISRSTPSAQFAT